MTPDWCQTVGPIQEMRLDLLNGRFHHGVMKPQGGPYVTFMQKCQVRFDHV